MLQPPRWQPTFCSSQVTVIVIGLLLARFLTGLLVTIFDLGGDCAMLWNSSNSKAVPSYEWWYNDVEGVGRCGAEVESPARVKRPRPPPDQPYLEMIGM